MRRGLGLLTVWAVLAAAAAEGGADASGSGISPDKVLFGQSAAFSGPAEALGLNMRLGIEAAFAEINAAGGVHGRTLRLLSLDDAYEPEAAIVNTHELIEREKVFALIGAVGTPTSRSAVPVASEAGVPYVAPLTGAAFLRTAGTDNVVNLRASYFQETEAMVDRLIRELHIWRIGVFYQDDSFGQAGYEGVRRALARRGMHLAAHGVYPRNTLAVKTSLLDLRRGAPEAVVLIGAYRPVAELISWSHTVGFRPAFITVSFVGGNALLEALGKDGPGVYVTQVVPFPTADSPPVVPRYRRALAAHGPDAEPGFVSLEGYLAGRLAAEGLERCGRALSRACFMRALRSGGPIDIDGFVVSFGEGDNQGSDAVFLTVIDSDGSYRSISDLREGRGLRGGR